VDGAAANALPHSAHAMLSLSCRLPRHGLRDGGCVSICVGPRCIRAGALSRGCAFDVPQARVVEQRESMMLYDPSGTYKFAQVCIEMRRDSQRFFCVILFSILLLVATYSGLWVSPTAAPARVTLAFLCFLMVLNNSTCHASRACFASHLHAVRDFDASSRWMCAVYDTLRVLPPLLLSSRVWLVDFLVGTTCFNFVLLLEYSAVNYSATLRGACRHWARDTARPVRDGGAQRARTLVSCGLDSRGLVRRATCVRTRSGRACTRAESQDGE
jgi:hypothetical protein